MTKPRRSELSYRLLRLGLSPKQAARFLSVDVKTVNRWLDGTVAVPGPVEQAIRAWERLEEKRIPWRPDGLPIPVMDDDEIEEQVKLMRDHVVSLDEVIQKVRKRGGPAAPWTVDLKQCEAVLAGTMHVHFYPLPNGNFSPSSYRRTDKEPDYERDLPLVEDAIVCIADEVAKAGKNWVNRR